MTITFGKPADACSWSINGLPDFRCGVCPGCTKNASSISANAEASLIDALSSDRILRETKRRLEDAEHYIELSHNWLCDAVRLLDSGGPNWKLIEAVKEAAAQLESFDGDLELPEMKEDD